MEQSKLTIALDMAAMSGPGGEWEMRLRPDIDELKLLQGGQSAFNEYSKYRNRGIMLAREFMAMIGSIGILSEFGDGSVQMELCQEGLDVVRQVDEPMVLTLDLNGFRISTYRQTGTGTIERIAKSLTELSIYPTVLRKVDEEESTISDISLGRYTVAQAATRMAWAFDARFLIANEEWFING